MSAKQINGYSECVYSLVTALGAVWAIDRPHHARRILELVPKDSIAQHESMVTLCDAELKCGEIASIRTKSSVALGSPDKTGTQHARIRLLLGGAELGCGELEKATELFEVALRDANDQGDIQLVANLHAGLGLVHLRKGSLDRARTHSEQALELCTKHNMERGVATCLGNLGVISIHANDINGAIDCYERALVLHRETGFKNGEAVQIANLGDAWREKGEFAKAFALLKTACQAFLQSSNHRSEAETQAIIGQTLFEQAVSKRNFSNEDTEGQVEKARESAERAISLYAGLGRDPLYRMKLTLALCEETLGNLEEAKKLAASALEIASEWSITENSHSFMHRRGIKEAKRILGR